MSNNSYIDLMSLSKLSLAETHPFFIQDESYFSHFNDYDISLPSSIIDFLIRKAAQDTERFASDLIISINCMEKRIKEMIKYSNNTNQLIAYIEWFGFRKNGVEHQAFIESRSPEDFYHEYRNLYRLIPVITNNDYKIDWYLTEMETYSPKLITKESYEENNYYFDKYENKIITNPSNEKIENKKLIQIRKIEN